MGGKKIYQKMVPPLLNDANGIPSRGMTMNTLDQLNAGEGCWCKVIKRVLKFC
jgi:hypothetical protein